MRKSIEGYEGFYEIDENGSIFSLERITSGKHGQQKVKACILKPIVHPTHGYCVVGLAKRGTTRQYRLHILVAKAFIPNPHNKPTVNHKDGVKTNNHKDNLEWATAQEQMEHAAENDLTAKHIRNGQAKLSEHQIRQALERCMAGEELQIVAASMGVNRNTLPKAFRRIGLGPIWDTEAQRRKYDASMKRWHG